MDFDDLRRLEALLKTPGELEESRDTLDAKVNILKYLQVQAVRQCHEDYDDSYYELNKTGGLDCLRSIIPTQSRNVLQPKVLELPDCGEEERLEKQLQFYLADAEAAKKHLDELVLKVKLDSSNYEVQYSEVKSRESTQRKARTFFSGDVRRVADMARVSVICDTPEDLKKAHFAIIGLLEGDVLRVANSFTNDWMPSGYRCVKLNPIVNEHLCEVHLHLREFFALKHDQHAVYEWARDFKVTTNMRAEYLFEKRSPDVTKEMVRLAELSWRGSGYFLPDLQLAAAQYNLAKNGFRQQLRDAEDKAKAFEDQNSKESRRVLLRANAAREKLAHVLQQQGKYEEAGPLYRRAIEIGEKELGPRHPDVASALSNWAGLLMAQGKYDEADTCNLRAMNIWDRTLGPEHPDVASALNIRAELFMAQGKYDEADTCNLRAMNIWDRTLGPEHPDVASALNVRAELFTAQGKHEEADPLFERSLAIREKILGPDHPAVAQSLNNWAEGLTVQGKTDEAEPKHERSCAIREKVLGPHHPDVAQSLNNRATLLKDKGKFAEAEKLYKQLLEIYSHDHPEMVTVLDNWAKLLESQGNTGGARRLREKIRAINDTGVNWNVEGCQFTKEASSGVDRLNYDAYAKALAGLFITGEGDVLPAAVGIYAPWGSGKSFLLDHLKSRLQDPPAPPSISATCCCCLAGLRSMICHSVWVVIMLAIFNGLREWFGSCCAAFRRSDAAIPKALVAIVGCCRDRCARKRTDGQPRDVEASLEMDASGGRAFVVVEFNAWECAGLEILWAVVTAKLFDAVEGHPAFGRGAVRAARIKKLLKDPSWNWCGLVTFFFAVALVGCGVVIALIATDAWDDIGLVGKSMWIVATLLLPGVLTALNFLVQIRSRGSFRTAHSVLRKAISNNQSVGKPYEGFMSEVKEELEMLFHLINTFNSEARRQREKNAGKEAETRKQRETLALAVIVDDLDRCSKEKIMEMLKATHLLLEQPKAPMAVFLAVDPQLIVSAISESLEGVSNMMKALQYLDKIIHLPFCIPALLANQKLSLLDSLLGASDNSCRSTLKLMKRILNGVPTEDGRKASSEAVNKYPWPVPVSKVWKELVRALHCWSQDKKDRRAEQAGKALENFRIGLIQDQDAPSRNRHASCVKGLEDLCSTINKLISNNTQEASDETIQEASDATPWPASSTGSVTSPGGVLPSTGPAVAMPGGSPRRGVPGAERSTSGTESRPGGGPGAERPTLQTAPRTGSVLPVEPRLPTSTAPVQTFNRMISEDEIKIFKALVEIVHATPRKIKRIVNVYFLQRSVVEERPGWKRDSNTRAEFVAWTILAEFWPFRLSCIAFAMMNDAPEDKPRKQNYADNATIAEVYGSPAGDPTTSVCTWINNYRGKGTPKELFQSDDTEGRFQIAMEVAMKAGARITKHTVGNCLLHSSFNLNPAIMSTIEVDMVYDSTETTESKSSDNT